MSLLNRVKLQKLTIRAFEDVAREKPATTRPFEAMFNPASLKLSYTIPWAKKQAVGSGAVELKYSGSQPGEVSVTLIFDGTGVDDVGARAILARVDPWVGQQTVTDRVNNLFYVTHRYNGRIHEPNYLRVEWGMLSFDTQSPTGFDCRLSCVELTYTAFNRDGTPLRAEAALTLLADVSDERRAKNENQMSPDVTHARIVRSGDTLPLLTKDIYGSADRYLDVARWNELDDFRNLVPGHKLHFPPLAQLDETRREPPEEG